MTTILLVAPKFNYGRTSEGLSYEYNNFYDPLVRMGHNVVLFDFMGILNRRGRDGMNRQLLEAVKSFSPQVLLAVPHRDELAQSTLQYVSEWSTTQTISWFSDDHWRFESHTRQFAPYFNWSVTTDSHALRKYAAIGYQNVIKSQWACNPFMYRPLELPLKYYVTFIGQPHGSRRNSVNAIRHAGVDVRVWGNGWPAGRLTQEQMLRIFCESRINLNLTNASPPRTLTGRIFAAAWRAAGSAVLNEEQRRFMFRALGLIERSLRPVLPREVWDPDAGTFVDQIKGRNFEVPGCGGFLLTGAADDLEQYYLAGREVATFANVHAMIDRIRHFLSHEEERVAVARAGYQRTLSEHTYVHRFTTILERVGLSCAPVADVLMGRVPAGSRLDLE